MSKKARVEKRKRDLYKEPPLVILDNIVFTSKAAWAYYILAEEPYDFLSFEGRVGLAERTIAALASLVRRNDTSVECHLLITNEAFDPVSWRKQMKRVHNLWIKDYNEPFEVFVNRQAKELEYSDFRHRVTYLGIKLYNRGSVDFAFNPLELGFEKSWEKFKSSVSSMFHLPNEYVSQAEELRAKSSEQGLFQIISTGSLGGKRPTSAELLLTIKRRLYPSMPSPYLEIDHKNRIGLSDVALEEGGMVEVKPAWLHMQQIIEGEVYDGYRATLSIAIFPDKMETPSTFPPFFARKSVLPFTLYSRFILIPTEKMRGELNKQKLQAEDEIKNLQSSGQAVTSSLRNTVENITDLEDELVDRPEIPWTQGSYHITIDAPTEELLKKTCTELKQEYSEDGCTLAWTTGDQLDLLSEEQLGGRWYSKSFQHTMSLSILAAAGFNFSGYVGDPITQVITTHKRARDDEDDL